MQCEVPAAHAPRAAVLGTLILLSVLLAACGGGGGSNDPAPDLPVITQFEADRAAYFVGDTARLTAVFSNGTGRIEPGDIAVVSGQAVTTPMLSAPIRYTLTVSNGAASVTRNLDLAVTYQDRLRQISAPFARAEHAAASLSDGRVIIFGGDGGGVVLPESIYAFNPATETFTHFGSLATGRVAFTAATLDNGDVLVFGGMRALVAAPSAEIIDGETGAVTPTQGAPMVNRYHAAATKLADGRVLITGGLRNGTLPEASVEIYDPASDAFTPLAGTLSVARALHTAVRIDDRKILVYGGVTTDHQPAPPELFDPVTATSTVLPAAESISRCRHIAHTLPDGDVWIMAGEDFEALPLRSVLRFHAASSTFSAALDLATPRSATAAERLTDNRVLIVGGITTSSLSSANETTELVTPPAQRVNGPSMSAKRHAHTATRLPSGKLLIFGGFNEAGLPLATAEIFE